MHKYTLDNICAIAYIEGVWEVEITDTFRDWYESLDQDTQERVRVVVDLLEQQGPSLRRPAVGEIKGSRFDPQMHELVIGSSIRILFMFDPRRVAILLLGGDKRGTWNAWYTEAVPQADTLYEEHLGEI
jgi:hypothetical protein